MKALTKVVVVANAGKTGACELADRIRSALACTGVAVDITTAYPLPEGSLQGYDLCCTIGGDGTVLSVVQEAVRWQVPVVGINQGNLGFLAVLKTDQAIDDLLRITSGDYSLGERTVLQCETPGGCRSWALNDVVIKSTDTRRLITLRVLCNSQKVTDYDCDGLIFCTPTGSTAYNLSAGGPIVSPDTRAITMTPICAHTLSNRSVVFPSEASLVVECSRGSLPQVTVDGYQRINHDTPFTLRVFTASSPLKVVLPMGHSWFPVLREKLHWGAGKPA